MCVTGCNFNYDMLLSFNVPQKNVIIVRIQLQLTYCNNRGKLCAFVQLWLISHHDYNNVLYARETN